MGEVLALHFELVYGGGVVDVGQRGAGNRPVRTGGFALGLKRVFIVGSREEDLHFYILLNNRLSGYLGQGFGFGLWVVSVVELRSRVLYLALIVIRLYELSSREVDLSLLFFEQFGKVYILEERMLLGLCYGDSFTNIPLE